MNGENEENKPALGLAWSHCVNSRIFLRRDTSALRTTDYDIDFENLKDEGYASEAMPKFETSNEIKSSTGPIASSRKMKSARYMTLELCPFKPTPIRCRFEVHDGGIRGLEDED